MTYDSRLIFLAASSIGLGLLTACGGGSSASGAGAGHELLRVSNGFGEILPHKTYKLETVGGSTPPQLLSIRTQQDLLDNVTVGNPVHSGPIFTTQAQLPSGQPGNQFLYAAFSKDLKVKSILSSSPGLLENNSMSGSVLVTAVEPVTGTSTIVRGRVLIDGWTYGDTAEGSPARLPWQQWVMPDGSANPNYDPDGDPDNGVFAGTGFPGTQGTFTGQDKLLSPRTIVFVVDSDSDLSTHETFPSGVQLRMEILTSVRSEDDQNLRAPAVACITSGSDTLSPEVLTAPPPASTPLISPGGGDIDVDPLTTITVRFSESMQPWTVGDLLSAHVPKLSSAIDVHFGPGTSVVSVPFHVNPRSVFDLTNWELIPAFNFPGEGPATQECGVFSRVDIDVRAGQLEDLEGNQNQLPGTTFFETGEGPGIVNVPVTPDAIYVGRTGGEPGISLIDLNGFGQGTGSPAYDPENPIREGNSNFPNNPNVRFNGTTMLPGLAPGSCTIDGGSEGVFTLSMDSSLNDRVVRTPVLQSTGDMMLGWSLDVAFNNAPAPFGCQGQGGNLCAATGFKQIATVIDGSTLSPAASNPNGTQILIDGGPNLVGWAPHPNPPPLVFPPLCVSPYLGGQEPTSVDTLNLATNLLVPGDPFGDPATGTPPSGLLASSANVFFQGPSLPNINVAACSTYGIRQQIGQFLYVIDRARAEIVVLNSNRMTVIDRIEVADPTTLAIGTNLDLLAVTSQAVGSVTFIDIDPSSSSFHQITKTLGVGNAPRGIAWEPGNEDILVCNEGDNSLAIISAFSLSVRKVAISGLDRPFEVAITPRQLGFGMQRNVYFAYILGRNGRVSVFESGPNSVNGWGYDDVVGTTPMIFRNPKTIQPDHLDIRSAFWVVHEGRLDQSTQELSGSPSEGAVTNVVADTGTPGQIPLSVGSFASPQLRDIHFGITVSMGEERLTGVPVDIAFDNMTNLGGIVNWVTAFSAGSAVPLNGKSIVRQAGAAMPTNQPRFGFVAVPNPTLGIGGVDVILLDGAYLRYDTNAFQEGIQSIPASNATVMMDYFRQ